MSNYSYLSHHPLSPSPSSSPPLSLSLPLSLSPSLPLLFSPSLPITPTSRTSLSTYNIEQYVLHVSGTCACVCVCVGVYHSLIASWHRFLLRMEKIIVTIIGTLETFKWTLTIDPSHKRCSNRYIRTDILLFIKFNSLATAQRPEPCGHSLFSHMYCRPSHL